MRISLSNLNIAHWGQGILRLGQPSLIWRWKLRFIKRLTALDLLIILVGPRLDCISFAQLAWSLHTINTLLLHSVTVTSQTSHWLCVLSNSCETLLSAKRCKVSHASPTILTWQFFSIIFRIIIVWKRNVIVTNPIYIFRNFPRPPVTYFSTQRFSKILHRVQILIAVFWYLCERNGLLKVQGWGLLKFSSNICTKMMGSSVSAGGFEEVFIILNWEETGLWLQMDTGPQLFGQLSCSSLGQMPRKLKYLSKDFIWSVSSCRIRPEKMKNDSTLWGLRPENWNWIHRWSIVIFSDQSMMSEFELCPKGRRILSWRLEYQYHLYLHDNPRTLSAVCLSYDARLGLADSDPSRLCALIVRSHAQRPGFMARVPGLAPG